MSKSEKLHLAKQSKESTEEYSVYDWGAIMEFNGLDVQHQRNQIVEAIKNTVVPKK